MKLKSRISNSVRQGRILPATVIDVFYNKATVRLSHTGALMRGLQIVGGPVKAGDTVNVDFTTSVPSVVAVGAEWLSQSDLDNALKKFGEQNLGQDVQITIVLFSGGGSVEMYPPSSDGLQSALTDAASGDVIYLPDVDITGDFEIPSGVCLSGISSRQTIIRGELTFNPGVMIENMTVVRAEDTETEFSTIEAQGVGTQAYIRNCEIHAYNCTGSGRVNAVHLPASTDLLVIQNTTIIADAPSGTAYAFKGEGGVCKVLQCFVFAKTSNFDGTTFYEYANVQAISESDLHCPTPADVIFPSAFQYPTTLTGTMSLNALTTSANVSEIGTGYNIIGRHPVLRYNEYIYFWSGGGTDCIIKEYNTLTDTTTTLTVSGAFSLSFSYPFLAVVGERQLVAMCDDTFVNNTYVFYLYDFSAETTSPIDSVPGEWLVDTDVQVSIQLPDQMFSVFASSGDVHIVVIGTIDKYRNYPKVDREGVVYITKNITQDTDVVIHENYISETNESLYTNQWFYGTVISDRYVVTLMGVAGNSADTPVGDWWTIGYIYDCLTATLTRVDDIQTASNGISESWACAASSREAFAYIITYVVDDTRSGYQLYKIDPALGTMDLVTYYDEADGDPFVIQSSTGNAFVLFENAGTPITYNLYELPELTVRWTDLSDPAGGWSLNWWEYAEMIDDDHRLWYWDETSGDLKGILTTDQSNVKTINTNIASGTDQSYYPMFIHLGDRAIVKITNHPTTVYNLVEVGA